MEMYAAHYPPGYYFPISTLFLDVLGELVQTTAGEWIIHPPTRCPTETPSAPVACLWVTRPALGTTAGTQRGRAAPAMRRCTGRRSKTVKVMQLDSTTRRIQMSGVG
jgi:hypothetical protein